MRKTVLQLASRPLTVLLACMATFLSAVPGVGRTTKAKAASVLALPLLVVLLSVGIASAAPGDADATLSATAELRKAVEPASILVHERRFQQIANDTEEGTRASGTPGYAASARYVAS
jgi:hypothetical protein